MTGNEGIGVGIIRKTADFGDLGAIKLFLSCNFNLERCARSNRISGFWGFGRDKIVLIMQL